MIKSYFFRPVFIFLLAFSLNPCRAQSEHLVLQKNFHHLDRLDGLPAQQVNQILEDSLGFIWMATNNGLCRYDGKEFKVWRASDSTEDGLKTSVVLSLAYDSRGWIWMNTERGGLNAYNTRKDKWYYWGHDSLMQNGFRYTTPVSIHVDKDESIWASSSWYLHHITRNDTGFGFETFEMELFPSHQKPLMRINDIAQDPNSDRLWLATARGIVGFDKKRRAFLYSKSQKENQDPPAVHRLLFSKGGYLYAGLHDGGLARIKAEEVEPGYPFNAIQDAPDRFNKMKPRNLWQSGEGEIFVAGHGIYRIEENEDGSMNTGFYYKIPNLPNSLPHNLIIDVIKDRAGNWWAASQNGVGVFYPSAPDFQVINGQTLGDENFDNRIYRIFKDSRGWFWFGGQDGLYLQKKGGEPLERLALVGNDPDRTGFLAGIDEDDAGNLWVAVAPYLYKINPQSLNFEQIRVEYPRPEINDIFILNLEIDHQGLVWLSTVGGLAIYNDGKKSWGKSRPNFKSYFYGVGFLSEDLYVAADNGFLHNIEVDGDLAPSIINRGDKGKNLMAYLNGTKDFLIHDSVAYISQRDGLLTYNYRNEQWKLYTESDGLPDNRVQTLVVDTKGKLWMTTDMGIARFDPGSQEIKTLAKINELPVSGFSSRASWAGDGNIYFGSEEGVLYFSEEALRANDYSAPVHITDLALLNKKLPISSASGQAQTISESPEYLRKLTLGPTENILTLRFAALNFYGSSQNKYAYRLKGFTNDWIEAENSNSATFTNLDPGEYSFEVKTANSSGVWSDQIATLGLTVLPPWYQTWWALLLFALILFSIVYFMWRLRLQAVRERMLTTTRVEKARMQEREEFRKRSAADFHDEAGNKLTKINLFTSLAKEQLNGNQELNKYLFKIEQNTKELSAGMRDFLWVMDPTRDSLFDTISRLKTFGESMFGDTHTDFRVSGLREAYHEIPLSMDARRAMMQIFKEGMNNCAKHARADNIVLKVEVKPTHLSLCLKDDGDGFDPGKLKEGSYGKKIMNDRADKIGAHLRINSCKGEGTELCLDYEIPHMSNVSN